MIEVRNLTKSYLSKYGREYIFKDVSFIIPSDRNVAILGPNGAGKSTLMRLIGGQDMPDAGRIITSKSISWPVGLSGGFQGSLTARENVKFVARVFGAGIDEIRNIVKYVEEFAEIGKYFDRPVKTFSSGMRSRVAFGLSLAFDFDYFLADEVLSVGDAKFTAKASAAFKEKMNKANIILVSHGMNHIKEFCNYALLVDKGTITPFDNIEIAIAEYLKK